MEIVKELNLNGNPQVVKNGSLVYAENIRLSADGSFITNDEGFKKAIIETYGEEGEEVIPILKVKGIIAPNTIESINGNIVGYINCPNEIVIFTSANKIYRLVECDNYDELCVLPVESAWVYSSGKISGTFIYNVNNELVISVAENKISGNIPLYIINLNKSLNSDKIENYTISPNLPICNLKINTPNNNVRIPAGVYYFFIRYELSYNNYTNWIPIGIPQYAINFENKTLVNHTYPKVNAPSDLSNFNINIINTEVNNAKECYSFNLFIEFLTENKYTFQLGYIYKGNGSIIARINKKYDKDVNKLVFDVDGDEETSIDNFITTVYNISNVKTVTSFDNKLYIANFKESNTNNINEDIIQCLENIKAYQFATDVSDVINNQSTTYTWEVRLFNTNSTVNETYKIESESKDEVRIPITNNGAFVSDTGLKFTKSGRGYNYPGTQIVDYSIGDNVSGAYFADVMFRTLWTNGLTYRYPDGAFNIQFLERYQTFTFILTKDGTFKLESTGRIERDTTGYDLYDGNGNEMGRLLFSRCEILLHDYDFITLNEHYRPINTLLPGEAYTFFIHFVNKDGSYTNGYPIKITNRNNKVFDYLPYYRSRAISLDTSITRFDKTEDDYIVRPDVRLKEETQIGIMFDNIICPENFEGYFISYYKYNAFKCEGFITEIYASNIYAISATELSLALCRKGNIIQVYFSGIWKIIESYPMIGDNIIYVNNIKIDRRGKENCIIIVVEEIAESGGVDWDITEFVKLDGSIIGSESIGTENRLLRCSIYSNYNSILDENVKLCPMGYCAYKTDTQYGMDLTIEETYDEGNDKYIINISDIITDEDLFIKLNKYYYGGYITEDMLLLYRNYADESDYTDASTYYYPLWFDTNGYVRRMKRENNAFIPSQTDANTILTSDYVKLKKYYKYSSFELHALTIKKEPEDINPVIFNSYVMHGIYVNPANVLSLFELINNYIVSFEKTYYKYNENLNYENVTPNMIRSSYPIRTESNENSWRKFDADDYYLIDKKAGEIINIFGIGKHFFIHTRNTLLVASSDAKLTADNTTISVTNHKLFDVTPSELFTSDLGYGGIKYRECQMLSNNGYFWYDTDHHKIFRFDNNKLIDLTSDIEEFVNKYSFEFCYFNLDNKTNRVFISLTNDNQNYYTFSYSTLTNKFISVLKFKFDKNIHTTDNVYFTEENNPIYKYDVTNFGDYKLLTTINNNSDIASRIDIVINVAPEVPKSLESIRWIHKYLHNDIIDENNYAELKEDNILKIQNSLFKNTQNVANNLKNVYLRIFNNNVDTGILSLYNDILNSIESIKYTEQQNIQSYKYPHYEKGVWQFNYFRDGILIDLTEDDINSITDEQEKNKWLKIVQTFDTKIINNVKHYYRLSDVQSLIYGTYFVISFIFKNPITNNIRFNKRLKFDSILTKINNY